MRPQTRSPFANLWTIPGKAKIDTLVPVTKPGDRRQDFVPGETTEPPLNRAINPVRPDHQVCRADVAASAPGDDLLAANSGSASHSIPKGESQFKPRAGILNVNVL
jgi:hypothetical protein